VQSVRKVDPELQEHKDLLVLKDLRAHKVYKVLREQQALRELLV
jgi:hypothetical protein